MGRPEALLAALARLRAEPALASALGAAGRAYAEAHLSEAACLARATALVDEVAERRTGTLSGMSNGRHRGRAPAHRTCRSTRATSGPAAG